MLRRVPRQPASQKLAQRKRVGAPPRDPALRTATIHAADLLGTPDRGRLAEGMLADIIAVPGNPLDDISVTEDVQFVMLGGRVVKHVMGGRDMHAGGH